MLEATRESLQCSVVASPTCSLVTHLSTLCILCVFVHRHVRLCALSQTRSYTICMCGVGGWGRKGVFGGHICSKKVHVDACMRCLH